MGLWEAIGNKYGRMGQVLAVATVVLMILGSAQGLHNYWRGLEEERWQKLHGDIQAAGERLSRVESMVDHWGVIMIVDDTDLAKLKEAQRHLNQARDLLDIRDRAGTEKALNHARQVMDSLQGRTDKQQMVDAYAAIGRLNADLTWARELIEAFAAMGDVRESDRSALAEAESALAAANSAYASGNYTPSGDHAKEGQAALDHFRSQIGRMNDAEQFVESLELELSLLEQRLDRARIVLDIAPNEYRFEMNALFSNATGLFHQAEASFSKIEFGEAKNFTKQANAALDGFFTFSPTPTPPPPSPPPLDDETNGFEPGPDEGGWEESQTPIPIGAHVMMFLVVAFIVVRQRRKCLLEN